MGEFEGLGDFSGRARNSNIEFLGWTRAEEQLG
jgi:hypothetical protein